MYQYKATVNSHCMGILLTTLTNEGGLDDIKTVAWDMSILLKELHCSTNNNVAISQLKSLLL